MKLLIPSVLVGLLIFSSCNPKPQPDFIFRPERAKLGQPVRFIDVSENANRLRWDFGDGIIKNDGREVFYAYPKPGTYEVKLKAWNKMEKKLAAVTKQIIVDAPTKDDLLGAWTYYLREDVVRWDDSTTKQTTINEITTNQNFFFDVGDTVYINDYGSNVLLRRYILDGGDLTIADTLLNPIIKYQVVKLFEGEMIWKLDKGNFFQLFYLKK